MSQRNPTRRIIYDGRRYITLRFSQRQGVSSALFISPHFLLQFHLNSHRLQFLSHFSGVIAWERCTSTSKTKAASLFCWRGRGTNRGKDGRRWRKGKMEGVQVGGCRCGGRMFHKLSRVSVGENITSSSCRKGSTWRSRRSKTPTQVCTNCFKSLEDTSATTTALDQFIPEMLPLRSWPLFSLRLVLRLQSLKMFLLLIQCVKGAGGYFESGFSFRIWRMQLPAPSLSATLQSCLQPMDVLIESGYSQFRGPPFLPIRAAQ